MSFLKTCIQIISVSRNVRKRYIHAEKILFNINPETEFVFFNNSTRSFTGFVILYDINNNNIKEIKERLWPV
jgi:hypothetical protein